MAHKIQIKRGNKADLPVLNDGEMGLCIDTQEVFVGSNGTNIPVGGQTEIVNNLTETVTGKALDATQGKVLNDLVSTVSGDLNALETTVSNIPIAYPTDSYLAFCANVNADSVAAALGKGNENKVHLLGYQLAMVSDFYNEGLSFPNLIQCDTINDIANNRLAMLEMNASPTLFSRLSANAYAVSKLYTEAKALMILNGWTTTQHASLVSMLGNVTSMGQLYNNYLAVEASKALEFTASKTIIVSSSLSVSQSIRKNTLATLLNKKCLVVNTSPTELVDSATNVIALGTRPNDSNLGTWTVSLAHIDYYKFAKNIAKTNTISSSATVVLGARYIPCEV